MKLKIKDKEIHQVINALDLYSRIWIGQYDHIMFEMRWLKDCRIIDSQNNIITGLFINLRNITLPGLIKHGFSASYGIFSRDRDVKAATAYDLQQEIRYKVAWFNNSDGGYTVDFRQPLPCNDDPLPFPHASCRKEKTETVLEVEVVQAHVNTILEAVEVRRCLENGDLKGLFSYYTNKEPALMIAEEIPKIYSEIPYHDYCQSQTASLQKLADGIRKQLPADRAIFHCPFSNIDIMIPMLTEGARLAKCPVCGIAHEVPHNDEGKKRIWHRNRNMFMPVS